MLSSASSVNFQHPLVSLSSISSCLCLHPRLPVTCIVPPNFPSITCFRRQFAHNMWTIQLAFRLFIICRIFLSSLSPCDTSLLHFSHDRSNWSSPFFFSTTIQKFTGISYLFSEVSDCLEHTQLLFICSTSLVDSLNLRLICSAKSRLIVEFFCAKTILDFTLRVHLA